MTSMYNNHRYQKSNESTKPSSQFKTKFNRYSENSSESGTTNQIKNPRNNNSSYRNNNNDNSHPFRLVNFAQKKGYQVEDPVFLKELHRKIENKYRINLKTGNKSYKFVEEKDLHVIKRHPHLVCFNLNQKPTYLFLTTYMGQKFCLYFSYEMEQVISIKHRFNASLYQEDTLLEGELVQVSKNNHIFLVSDLLVWEGKSNQDNFDKKLKIIEDIVNVKYKPDPGFDPCQILVKDFIEYHHIDSFFKQYLHTVSYQEFIGGLIFRPIVKSNRNIIVVLNKKDFHNIQINLPAKNLQKSSSQFQTNSNYTKNNNTNTPPNNTTITTPTTNTTNTTTNTTPTTNTTTNTTPTTNTTHEYDYNTSVGQQKTQSITETDLPDFDNLMSTGLNISDNRLEKIDTQQQDKLHNNVDPPKRLKIAYKKHTEVNFLIRRTTKPDVYELMLRRGRQNELFVYGIASIPTRECSELVKSWFLGEDINSQSLLLDSKAQIETNEEELKKSFIIIGNYVKSFSKWKPIRLSEASEPDKIEKLII